MQFLTSYLEFITMKKIISLAFGIFLFLSGSAHALDPVAPRSERAFGIVYVKTPLPGSDIVTLISKSDPKDTQKLQAEVDVKVKVGDYLVKVEMQNPYTYEQEVSVRPTERHDIIVPGFGNVIVKGAKGNVEAYAQGSSSPVAKFATNYVKTLPEGTYDLKVKVGSYTLDQKSISVITNTTREVDVKL
jgi:hypothetical protein